MNYLYKIIPKSVDNLAKMDNTGRDENAIYLIDIPIHASPEFILLHEIIHCIDDLTDMHEDDENRVDAKAQLLLAFIKYNQDLIQTLIKKELYN